jgi:hypothetical protein
MNVAQILLSVPLFFLPIACPAHPITMRDTKPNPHVDESLDESLEETFPASDPIAPADPEIDEIIPED